MDATTKITPLRPSEHDTVTYFPGEEAEILKANLESVRKCRNVECRAKVFPLLYQMSQVIAESADLSHTLIILLQIMEQQMNIVCGMVTLFHSKTGKITIHESFGLTEEEESKGVGTIPQTKVDRTYSVMGV